MAFPRLLNHFAKTPWLGSSRIDELHAETGLHHSQRPKYCPSAVKARPEAIAEVVMSPHTGVEVETGVFNESTMGTRSIRLPSAHGAHQQMFLDTESHRRPLAEILDDYDEGPAPITRCTRLLTL